MKQMFLVLLFLILIPAPIMATEEAAQETGLNCMACHYSPAGGPRNIRGRYYQRTGSLDGFEVYLQELKSKADIDTPTSGGAGIVKALVENLSLQGDFESFYLKALDKNMGSTQGDNFYLMQAQMALTIDIHKNLSMVWASDLNDFSNTDAYILWRGTDQLHFRAGRILAPFGLYLRDHTTLIRGVYGLQNYLRDTGIELGWDWKGTFINASLLNGIRQRGSLIGNTGEAGAFDTNGRVGDENEGLGLVVNGGYRDKLWEKLDFVSGASFLWEQTHATAIDQDELLLALYSAIKWWRFVFLAETDIGWHKGLGISTANGGTVPVSRDAINASPYLGGRRTDADFGERSIAFYNQLIFLIQPERWDISVSHSLITPNSDHTADGQQRWVFASRMYPIKNLYFEPQYRLNIEPDSVKTDNDQLLVLLGAYF